MPHLMKAIVFKHCKHGWKYECDCDFCTRKRYITTTLKVDAWYDGNEWGFERWASFNSKRHWFRNELKQMRDEAIGVF